MDGLDNGGTYVILAKFRLGGIIARRNAPSQRASLFGSGSYTAHYFLGQVYRALGQNSRRGRELKLAARIQQLQRRSISYDR